MKSRTIQRLFVAPHLDDGAVSFGGTLLADREEGAEEIRTLVATVFSRSNYTKEGLGDATTITQIRQAEEKTAMDSINVATLFMDFLECPLRGYTLSDPLDYPKSIKPELDADIVEKVAECLDKLFKDFDDVVIPLAVGDQAHVDHQIVRQAAAIAQRSNPNVICRIYEDVPYISREDCDRVSSLDGFRLEETAIDLETKLSLLQGYPSQPVEAREHLIRRAAGKPPVERRWLVVEPGVLEGLGRFA